MKSLDRASRIASIVLRTGDVSLMLEAITARRTESVDQFIAAGGVIASDTVSYGGLSLSRSGFRGVRLAALAAFRHLVDYGVALHPVGESTIVDLTSEKVSFKTSATELGHVLLMLHERFIEREYSSLEARGSVVIDVGANFGDSTVYFASRGAAAIYAYEPLPQFHRMAIDNVAINRLSDVVVTCAAVGRHGCEPTTKVGMDPVSGRHQRHFLEVPQIALDAVFARVHQEHPGMPIACKVDCEGCEYELMTSEAFSGPGGAAVSQVILEYHRSTVHPIDTVLAGLGFEVRDLGAARGAGILYAVR